MLQVKLQYHSIEPQKCSMKFSCLNSGDGSLTCCFEFQGAERLIKDGVVPEL